MKSYQALSEVLVKLSWLTPLVLSPPLVKPFSREVKGCYAPDSLVRSYLLLREEQFLNEYEAITTWGSAFLNPTLKPSDIH